MILVMLQLLINGPWIVLIFTTAIAPAAAQLAVENVTLSRQLLLNGSGSRRGREDLGASVLSLSL